MWGRFNLPKVFYFLNCKFPHKPGGFFKLGDISFYLSLALLCDFFWALGPNSEFYMMIYIGKYSIHLYSLCTDIMGSPKNPGLKMNIVEAYSQPFPLFSWQVLNPGIFFNPWFYNMHTLMQIISKLEFMIIVWCWFANHSSEGT